jgi:hypothetical protein
MDTRLLIRNPRLWRLLLLITILLAFGLRVHQLDDFGFWLDEGLTPLRSSYSVPDILSNRITIQEGVTRDTHPPFYYLLILVLCWESPTLATVFPPCSPVCYWFQCSFN